FVLGRQRDDLVARRGAGYRMGAGEMRRAFEREVVGLGRPRGEDDLARVGLDQPREVGPRRLDRPHRVLAVDVALAVRVAEMLGEIGQHRLEDARVERRRGLVVEIDRQPVRAVGHAALRDRRRDSAVQASRKCAISASVVDQPRVTRIVAAAISRAMPIAARTWLGPTLPEEHAAPALTITPARSSAMTWVSADTPGMA